MRSRSHRLQTAEPRHDDWVDGSWTVDCVCGVTFDDGEEMVDCDECGVWVHTRCSRYVKSEKSFACDKCKSKSGGGGGIGNESEETEVAEFLVELPNKAMGTDNPNPATVASRRPFRLWAETPMEERVHVQGRPGGEPSLFSGINMSSIFGSQLWKSTGYVPKKFSLRYTEFPFSGQGKEEEEEMDKTNGEKSSARADNGARVLVSLLNKNESSLPAPVVDSAIVKGLVEGRVCGEIVAPRQKKLDSEKSHSVPEDGVKKKRNSVTVVLNSGKRKKEEHRALKDQNVKKKVRVVEKEGDVRKRAAHDPKAAVPSSTFSSDAKLLESSQDRGCKGVNSDLQCGKNLGDHLLDRLGECATNLASNEHGIESTPKNDVSSGEILRVENKGAHVAVECENLSNTCNGMESSTEVKCLQSLPVKEEVTGDTLQRCLAGTGSVGIGSCEKEPAAVGVKIAARDAKESGHGQDSDLDEANSRPIKKLRTDLDADDHKDHVVESVHLNEVKLDGPKALIQYPILSVKVVTGEGEVVGASNIKAEASEAKVLDANRSLVCRPRTDKPDESTANAHLSKREHSASEGSLGAKKRSSGLKPGSEAADELLKSNGTARSHSTASYQRKAGVSVLRSNSASGIVSKSSENCMGATAQNSSIHVRQELSDSSQGTMKDNTSADKVDRVEKSGRTKKLVKESLRSGALSKISETNKLSNTTDSKKSPSDSKDPNVHSSSKAPLSKLASSNVSGESASPPPTEGGSNMQNKGAASAIPGKGEKPHQSGSNPSSRGHAAAMTSPASSNVPATLSDEELALLLHQELNSSPRVPRVPRMRHAGSLPQLTGPSATSVLMKRTSNGVKDHGMACRRRTKDSSGEGLHAYPKVDNEAKKMERKPNSPDNRRHDSGYSIDQQSRKEADGGLVKSTQSMKKTNTNSLSSSTDANGHHLSSSRLSSRNTSDDDTRIAGRQTNPTLPGLIAEIMSEGKRMTYEELCNAVLPHWPHLRKHNGERYAYSSHSQAVLDCLRNRSEWARLVDRGPKTNASRKRHKHDADSMSIESEDNEDHPVKNSKDDGSKSFDSHQEEFPKGKRKARKRRRLALQGRGVVRRRRRADVVSDDESESFSYSSEDSASSEEEIQGVGTSAVGSEVSASSDEAE